jgi:2-polyprenyl-3-methyl-5-hydroxy-6-metoxy-1,4-benzoquinol methylase
MRTEQEMVAYALEVDLQLLPYIPELLADLEELGSDAEWITQVIAGLELAADSEVIDLGCGKGAVAVEIADELGFKVLGIDLFEPFINSARELAVEMEVSALCEFRVGNVLDMAAAVGPRDVVVFAALGDVLGRLDDTVKVIREYVKPGGVMLISDLFLAAGGSNEFPGFERYAHHSETIALLTSSGDVLLREVLLDDNADGDEELEDDEAEKIRERAIKLALQHPELEDALMHFASEQARENEFVEANLIEAVWVLRKT